MKKTLNKVKGYEKPFVEDGGCGNSNREIRE